MVGLSLMPGLLIEEKDAAHADGHACFVHRCRRKIALVYQLALSVIVLTIQGAFTGQVLLTLLSMVFGSWFSLLPGKSPVAQVMRVLPTFYLADGIYRAMQGQAATGGVLFNLSILAGSTCIIFVLTAWLRRRHRADP